MRPLDSVDDSDAIQSSPTALSPYYRAADVRQMVDTMSRPPLPSRPRPPPLELIKGQFSSDHDYESLHLSSEMAEEEEVVHNGKKRKYTKITIASAPNTSIISPPYVPEGGN